MATIADITTLANATAAAHGYTYATYQVTQQGQVKNIVKLTKLTSPAAGAAAQVEFGGYGDSASLTTAKANALVSLNNNRRHRYAGSPGVLTGATVSANEHGDTQVVDTN